MDNSCFYCTKDSRLTDLMSPICDLPSSNVYFFKDQRYLGRCVVAFKDHKTEIYQLSDEERNSFFADVSSVAEVLSELYHPDKINYAIYGDLVSHFHVHLVPKHVGGPEWGGPFTDKADKKYLDDAVFNEEIEKIRNALAEK